MNSGRDCVVISSLCQPQQIVTVMSHRCLGFADWDPLPRDSPFRHCQLLWCGNEQLLSRGDLRDIGDGSCFLSEFS